MVGLSKRGQEFTKTFFCSDVCSLFSGMQVANCRSSQYVAGTLIFVNPASVMNNLYTGQVSIFSAN